MNKKNWRAVLLLAAAVAGLGALALAVLRQQNRDNDALQARMAGLVPVGAAAQTPCAEVAAGRPFVVLALGQSNAANHGSLAEPQPRPVMVFADGRCAHATDPLPGGTGQGGSIWSQLAARTSARIAGRPLLVALLAVESTTVDDWTRSGSPLRRQLGLQLDALRRAGFAVDVVLWQQGEADALRATPPERYRQGLEALAAQLDAGGVSAPVLLARSTVCRTPPAPALHTVIDQLVASGGRWRLGPDTDQLTGAQYRLDGCHFSAAGLSAAAGLWVQALDRAGLR